MSSELSEVLQALIDADDLKGIVDLKAKHPAKKDQELIGDAMESLRYKRIKHRFDSSTGSPRITLTSTYRQLTEIPNPINEELLKGSRQDSPHPNQPENADGKSKPVSKP